MERQINGKTVKINPRRLFWHGQLENDENFVLNNIAAAAMLLDRELKASEIEADLEAADRDEERPSERAMREAQPEVERSKLKMILQADNEGTILKRYVFYQGGHAGQGMKGALLVYTSDDRDRTFQYFNNWSRYPGHHNKRFRIIDRETGDIIADNANKGRK